MPETYIFTWKELNDELRKLKTMEAAQALFQEERRGANRKRWLRRIHSRFRVLRTQRERKELRLE